MTPPRACGSRGGENDLYGKAPDSTGKSSHDLYASINRGAISISPDWEDDLRRRVDLAIRVIEAPESIERTLQRFVRQRFAEL